ncbi:MAG: hypothetical protein ACP5TL_03350, partial [Candidatus Micrarchaeia archaeon]
GIGEAPQLSSTYAKYDDGASVFNVYQNFAGTSCPAGWSCYSGSTINNGLTLNNANVTSVNQYYPQIFETLAFNINSNLRGEQIDYVNGSNNAYNNNQPYWGHGNIGSTNGGDNGNPPSITSEYIQSIGWSGSTLYWWDNYTNQNTQGTGLSPSSVWHIRLTAWPSGYSSSFHWVRMRAFPPADVMPSVSFGSVS